MAQLMDALVKAAPGVGLELRQVPIPEPGPGQVLIKIHKTAICGTDVHIYEGDKGAAEVTPPTILGHEFSGIVEKVGEAVTDYRPGDRVCVDPNCYCGACTPCRNGAAHYCEHMIGYGTTVNGGFAEYCAVNVRQVYRLGERTSFEQGAMAEPVACCLHGIDMCRIQPGSQAVVIGGGMIGLLMLQLAKLVIELTGSRSEIIYKELPQDDPVQRKPVIELAKKELQWEPSVKLEDGLKKTIDYFRTIV